MGRIALLGEALINKIAAGEVVERPASVVKELSENAVDAEARNVRVSLVEGGLTRIVVADDGHGMGADDAVLALSRHATSKLRDAEGLFRILTKGFRGEALPAIASVSRFTLTTSERDASCGTRVVVVGGVQSPPEQTAPSEGTIITVEDLFFNVPARRKFMKREQTELGHCEEALIRLALAHPEVGFFLDHEGRTLLSSPPCPDDPRERIAAALGAEAHAHLIAVDERWLGIRVSGFVATAEYTLPTARGLYCLVNRRYVRDRGLIHAVQRGYQDTLPPGRQPVVVLYLDVDPAVVDVNVHPQKLEVRFSDPRGVYDAVHAAVAKAIRSASSLHPVASAGVPEMLPGAHYAQAVDRFLARARGGFNDAGPPLPVVAEGAATLWTPPTGEVVGFGQARPEINEAPPPGFFAQLRHLGTLGKRFWVCEGTGGTLVVVDPHAAMERLLLSELVARPISTEHGEAQSGLFPASVELPPNEARDLSARLPLLERLGLGVEPFGHNAFVVESAPAWLHGVEWASLLGELVSLLPVDGDGFESVRTRCLQAMACRGAAMAMNRQLGAEETRELFHRLDRADFTAACAHSRIVVTEVPFLELVRRAGS